MPGTKEEVEEIEIFPVTDPIVLECVNSCFNSPEAGINEVAVFVETLRHIQTDEGVKLVRDKLEEGKIVKDGEGCKVVIGGNSYLLESKSEYLYMTQEELDKIRLATLDHPFTGIGGISQVDLGKLKKRGFELISKERADLAELTASMHDGVMRASCVLPDDNDQIEESRILLPGLIVCAESPIRRTFAEIVDLVTRYSERLIVNCTPSIPSFDFAAPFDDPEVYRSRKYKILAALKGDDPQGLRIKSFPRGDIVRLRRGNYRDIVLLLRDILVDIEMIDGSGGGLSYEVLTNLAHTRKSFISLRFHVDNSIEVAISAR